MSSLFRKLMPQQESFFPLFDDHARILQDAAERLRAAMEMPGEGGAGLRDVVEQGRERWAAISALLRSSFVTPFDRSDIKEMSSSMQSLLEDMQALAVALPGERDGDLAPFGASIAECATLLREGIAGLEDFDRNAQALHAMRERVGDCRRRMLDLRERSLSRLFRERGTDPLAALAASRRVQMAAGIVDRLDDVADHVDDLVLDHV
jgi:uncharacterized protein Yka (UPF0111/DUF47 family)